MKFKDMAANIELEESGVWVPIQGDFQVKISRANSKRARDAFRKYLRPIQRKMEAGAITDEEGAPILARYIVHGLMHDWRGAEDDSGNPVPFSAELAIQQLSLPEMKDVRSAIQEAAGDRDVFKSIEEDVSALKNVSSGDSKPASS